MLELAIHLHPLFLRLVAEIFFKSILPDKLRLLPATRKGAEIFQFPVREHSEQEQERFHLMAIQQ